MYVPIIRLDLSIVITRIYISYSTCILLFLQP